MMTRFTFLCIFLALYNFEIGHSFVRKPLKKSPYLTLFASKHNPNARILNGEEAVPHEFPFMAMITESDGWQFCGGALIDANWVVTAGHCVEASTIDNVKVGLGVHDQRKHTGVEQFKNVDRIVLHEGFIKWNLTNDIALLHLETPATFTKEVAPICEYHSQQSLDHQDLMTMGWGMKNKETGESSDVLLKLPKEALSNSKCKDDMKTVGLDHAVYGGSLCAYGGGHGKDVCFGDSGSPLVWKNGEGKWVHVGLTSWGLCATSDVPAVYTRVSYFYNWISKNAVGAQLC